HLDAMRRRQRITALRQDARLAVLGDVIHQHADRLGADREIHRAADRRRGAGVARVPVGEIALLRHLERAEHGEIEMAAADHQKRVRVAEGRAARQEGRRLDAGIENIGIGLLGLRRRPHADDADLGLKHDLTAHRNVIRDEARHADAEIDVGAVPDVLRRAPGDLFSRQRFHACAFQFSRAGSTTTTRSTKMPWVWTWSGWKWPSGTISCTCATAIAAAWAITGLKLRREWRITRLPQRSA